MIFHLQHKDKIIAKLDIDHRTGSIKRSIIIQKDDMPFLGSDKREHLEFWWRHRGIPSGRKDLPEILKKSRCATPQLFLVKNLALSLTDCYWIKPEKAEFEWKDVNLFHNAKQIEFSSPDGQSFSNDPSASLGGRLPKEWRNEDGVWYILKGNETADGQQGINELFANLIHYRQGIAKELYTKYETAYVGSKNKLYSLRCKCASFTNESLELVSAYEIISSIKKRNDISDYEHFLNVCSIYGLEKDKIRAFMDYLLLVDFLMTNTDRHYNNFGILRNPDTLRFICPAPMFDFGNSMFYKDMYTPSREEILSIPVSSFSKKDYKQLKYVRNRKILNIEALPSVSETRDFYVERGVNKAKADCIAENYETKMEILSEFQKGSKISPYLEHVK